MKKVVIIGGGFAGAKVSKLLENKFNVFLIDSKGYFEFTPSTIKTVVNPIAIKKIQLLHTHYLKRAKVINGTVKHVDVTKKYVVVNKKKIDYDYLVISSGSSYSPPFKSRNMIKDLRAINLRECYEKLCNSKSILVVGGGLVGIEIASEIVGHYKNKKVTIVHPYSRLAHRLNKNFSKYVEDFFNSKRVRILKNRRIVSDNQGFLFTNLNEVLKAEMIFLCTGIKPNSDFLKRTKLLNNKGYVKVNNFLQAKGYHNIFAAGDITDINEEKLAQNAEYHACLIAYNILNLEEKKPMKRYVPTKRVVVVSLGKFNGVINYKNINIKGFFVPILKWLIERKTMYYYSYI